MKVKNFFNKILDVLFPPNYKCEICGDEIIADNPPYFCEKCAKSLPKIENPCKKCGGEVVGGGNVCTRCKNTKFEFNQCFSCFLYEGQAKNLIYKLKYSNSKHLKTSMAKVMSEEFLKHNIKPDVVIPVPSCAKNLKKRGYNQAELLSESVAKNLSIKHDASTLIRVKETESQTQKNFKQRQENLINAFAVKNKNNFKEKVVLIVDDVITTGATLNECAKAVLKCKSAKIYCLTFASTPRPAQFEN